uniref:Uncharacterized protein n=1 Tax=Siphoviridae sp. ct13O11 TaxID=2825303 RepID=A0A8S5UD62_9CAUD|nr:MAG TPA: hypothetical protein [Siphoviridae sp. ct13O11]
MKIADIQKVEKNASIAYQDINHLMSDEIALLDLAYPNHDGEQDADAVGEMLYLRKSVASLKKACEILETKLTRVVGE